MTLQKGIIPVLAAPAIDAGQGRIAMELPAGLTIAEIVDQALPDKGLPREFIRVALVSPSGSAIVLEATWDRVRPRPGVRVVIRVVPGKGALKSILSIVVSIAAVALGAYFAPTLVQAWGISTGLAQGIIGLGVTVLGNLLINALIPPPKQDDDEAKNRYTITGWRNRIDPDGAVPVLLGQMRFAAPFAVLPWTQIIGDDQYICSVFNVGYGRVLIDEMRIGETSLSEYHGVDVEIREGLSTDEPLTLAPSQIAEESVGADLTRPLPRDSHGEYTSGPSIETPVTRTTGADASGASVIIAFPAGLFKTNDKGEVQAHSVTVRIQQRRVQDEDWSLVRDLRVSAKVREAFYRQFTWDFPERGRWQVRLIMMTAESSSLQVSQRAAWAVLQTLRPEYPIDFAHPLALISVRVKATHQLNGQLDNFNIRARRVVPDYDHVTGTWIERETRNPAALYRYALQSPANARPVSDAGIDLEQLEDWHDFCRLKGLKYDRVIDDPSLSLRDVLTEIAAAGRASPRHDGLKWGVVIDRPQELIVDHFSPRNSYGFKVSRSYVRRPDGIRVQFLDETNDHKQAERFIPWPGHEGPIMEFERMEHPGKTDPDEVYRETVRRMYEVMYRPDVYNVSLDGPISVATRGDKVLLSQDVIERTQVAARVLSASGRLIEIDETVTMVAGESYAVRYRVFADAEDTVGTSVVRTVVNSVSETSLLLLDSDGALPDVGGLVLFGEAGRESSALIVTAVEAGQGLSSHLRLVDAAPIIDELVDALEIPAWSGRAGAEIAPTLMQPSAPRFTSVVSGVAGTGSEDGLAYLIEPGASGAVTALIGVEHRLVGASAWTEIDIAPAEGGGDIVGYAFGDEVELRARGKSAANIAGPYTPVIAVTIGSLDSPIPLALDSDMITVGALLGGAVVQFSTGDNAATTRVQIYRSTVATLDRDNDAVGEPLAVLPSRGYSAPIGDTTRENLLTNGGFDSAASWTLGSDWSIAAGKASKVAGSASTISQPILLGAGKYYRVAIDLSDVTAGTLTPQLTGGTVRNGTARTADGAYSDRIQAVTGNDGFALAADPTFEGSVDNLVLYLETSTCLVQGDHHLWLEPQNDDGVPGPVAGPFAVTIK